jgi:hypothetical protein
MKEAAKLIKVVKYGEVVISRYSVCMGYSDLNELVRQAIPNSSNIQEDVKFNGKITITIEELKDEQTECNFAIPKQEEEIDG